MRGLAEGVEFEHKRTGPPLASDGVRRASELSWSGRFPTLEEGAGPGSSLPENNGPVERTVYPRQRGADRPAISLGILSLQGALDRPALRPARIVAGRGDAELPRSHRRP